MKLFVDSKEQKAALNSVKVIIPDMSYYLEADEGMEECKGDLHINITPEGVILDMVDPKLADSGDDVIMTASFEHHQLVDLLEYKRG
jgi:hypothetical protein